MGIFFTKICKYIAIRIFMHILTGPYFEHLLKVNQLEDINKRVPIYDLKNQKTVESNNIVE